MRAGSSLLAALTLAAAPAAAWDDDPQAALERAHAALEVGDIGRAQGAARALRELLEDGAWDPDGSIAGRLLPETEARIARLRSLSERLGDGPGVRREGRNDSPPIEEPEDAASWIEWALADIERRRSDLDRLAAAAAPGLERGALLQSARFAAAKDDASVGALAELPDMWRALVAPLLDRDERIGILRVKQDGLKREVLETTLERGRLEERLRAMERRQAALGTMLIEFIGFERDAAGEAAPADAGSELDRALAARIREVWMELKGLEHQSPLHKARCVDEIVRFRLANSVSVSGGGRDQTMRVDALAAALDAVPVGPSGPGDGETRACRR